jgi:fermentation-respiration switch protein FrsA (DUF1100 family)
MPMLFLAGEKDEVIPHNHMEELFAAAGKTSTKGTRTILSLILTVVWKSWPGAMHNDTCMQSGYFEAMEQFVVQNVYSTPRRRGRTLGDSEKKAISSSL